MMSQALMFPELQPPASAITPEMRRDLLKLEEARPDGLVRFGTAWSSFGLRIGPHRHVFIVNQGLARVDYSGRNPRLKITPAGRRAIGAYE